MHEVWSQYHTDFNKTHYHSTLGFSSVSVIICLPMQETWVQSLGLEDPLEKEMATHSSILAWRIPWTEEPGGPQPMEVTKEWDMT